MNHKSFAQKMKSYTILYVEDDISAQENMRLLLDDEVKELYQAYDGVDGLELYKEEKPDIIILDFNMPNMNGLDMIEEVQKTKPDLKFIIMSAHTEPEYLKTAERLGVEHYLLKPFDFLKFINLVYEIEVN